MNPQTDESVSTRHKLTALLVMVLFIMPGFFLSLAGVVALTFDGRVADGLQSMGLGALLLGIGFAIRAKWLRHS